MSKRREADRAPNPAPLSAAAGRAYRCGQVAIVGRPNVGKSTLLNALVGAKISITSKKPQTTRHRVLGILTTPEEQCIFVDTPGYQKLHASLLNERMNRAVRDALSEIDVIVVVLEAGRLTDADRAVLALLPASVPAIAAVNKVDRLKDKASLLPYFAQLSSTRDFAAIVPISAEKQWQLDDLLAEIAARLPVGGARYAEDEITDRDERFLASEYLREKIFRALGEEVPYSTSVGIDSFEHAGDLRRIHATVYVDKANHRAMLVGEGGLRMKAMASAARRDMEKLFGGRVFLEVWVRVKSGWADDKRMLDQLGY
jgi:GTP-binding protein Era